jgi:hypothetical protein
MASSELSGRFIQNHSSETPFFEDTEHTGKKQRANIKKEAGLEIECWKVEI